jgi:hypothetical protein
MSITAFGLSLITAFGLSLTVAFVTLFVSLATGSDLVYRLLGGD